MKRRAFLQSAAGSTAALSPLGAAPNRPNVLIILADDLGTHDVGFRGAEYQTPNLDRLVREGVQFDRAYSFPVCSPTRSGLMTGRSPMRLGVAYTVIRPWSDYGVPVEERFLPQAFQEAGYQTAICGKWHLGHAYRKFLPNARGFDHAYGHLNGAIDYYTHEREGGLDWNRNGKSVREQGYSTFLLGQEAERFIRQRDKRRPFFCYLPFNSPHTPLQAPPEYLERYASIKDPRRRAYAAMTTAMDTAIGQVLKAVRDEGLEKDTLVLFFSDNGGPTGAGATNTPLRAGKGTTFEGGIRVPAVMRWPGRLPEGTVSQQVITMMDYFPTLAAAAGVAAGNRLPFDGRNLWPLITAGKTEVREDIFFAIENAQRLNLAVHAGPWKLVRDVARGGAGARNLLFRIDEDQEEKNDLAAKEPKVAADLARRIAEWQKLHPANGVREVERAADWKAPALWAEAAREG